MLNQGLLGVIYFSNEDKTKQGCLGLTLFWDRDRTKQGLLGATYFYRIIGDNDCP